MVRAPFWMGSALFAPFLRQDVYIFTIIPLVVLFFLTNLRIFFLLLSLQLFLS
jgi:hypothetical protein